MREAAEHTDMVSAALLKDFRIKRGQLESQWFPVWDISSFTGNAVYMSSGLARVGCFVRIHEKYNAALVNFHQGGVET